MPPKAPPLANGLRRLPARARTTRRRARGRPARRRSSAASAPTSPGGQLQGVTHGHRRVASRHLPGATPGPGRSVSATTQPPSPSGTATKASARRAVLGEAPAPEGHGRPHPWAAPPRSWPAGAAAARSRGPPLAGSSGGRRWPAGDLVGHAAAASRTLHHPVHRHRWASRARAHRRRRPPASVRRLPRAASRMMIPGVQNPHWLAPRVAEGLGPRRRGRRGRVPRAWSRPARPPAGPG